MEDAPRRPVPLKSRLTLTLLCKLVVVMRVASSKDLLAGDSGNVREESVRFGGDTRQTLHCTALEQFCTFTQPRGQIKNCGCVERLIGNDHECGTRERVARVICGLTPQW